MSNDILTLDNDLPNPEIDFIELLEVGTPEVANRPLKQIDANLLSSHEKMAYILTEFQRISKLLVDFVGVAEDDDALAADGEATFSEGLFKDLTSIKAGMDVLNTITLRGATESATESPAVLNLTLNRPQNILVPFEVTAAEEGEILLQTRLTGQNWVSHGTFPCVIGFQSYFGFVELPDAGEYEVQVSTEAGISALKLTAIGLVGW